MHNFDIFKHQSIVFNVKCLAFSFDRIHISFNLSKYGVIVVDFTDLRHGKTRSRKTIVNLSKAHYFDWPKTTILAGILSNCQKKKKK